MVVCISSDQSLARLVRDSFCLTDGEALVATGKPHRSAKSAGYLQAELVGVGLPEKLGWGEKDRRVSQNKVRSRQSIRLKVWHEGDVSGAHIKAQLREQGGNLTTMMCLVIEGVGNKHPFWKGTNPAINFAYI
jgi:hypothetical protein